MGIRLRRAAGLLAVAAAGAAFAEDGVRLRFAWPDTLVAQVQSQNSRFKQVEDQPRTGNSAMSQYVLRAQRQGAVHVVSVSNMLMDTQRLAALTPQQRAFLEIAAKASPSYRVSAEGEFIGIDDLKGFQATMRSMMETLFADSSAREKFKPALDMMTSEAVLTNVASEDWSWMVGNWAGDDNALDIGADYAVTTLQQVALLNKQLTGHLRFKVARKLPCEREGVTRECVELQASHKPDEAQLRELVMAFVSRLSPKDAAKVSSELGALNQETTLELVTETATLIPHQYKLRKTRTALGDGKKLRQFEECVQSYLYPRPD